MDLCTMCSHGWHGLICDYEISKLDENYRFTVKEKCKCPGPFAKGIEND